MKVSVWLEKLNVYDISEIASFARQPFRFAPDSIGIKMFDITRDEADKKI